MTYPHIYPHLTTHIHFTPLFLFGQPHNILPLCVKGVDKQKPYPYMGGAFYNLRVNVMWLNL